MIFQSIDLLSGSGVVGGIVALATTLGWWLRRERVESAKANNTVTANNATSDTYAAQAKEIAAVRERLSAMEAAYVAQAVKMSELVKKISELEARIVGANAHYNNLLLCDVCLEKNERVLSAMNKNLSDHHMHD